MFVFLSLATQQVDWPYTGYSVYTTHIHRLWSVKVRNARCASVRQPRCRSAEVWHTLSRYNSFTAGYTIPVRVSKLARRQRARDMSQFVSDEMDARRRALDHDDDVRNSSISNCSVTILSITRFIFQVSFAYYIHVWLQQATLLGLMPLTTFKNVALKLYRCCPATCLLNIEKATYADSKCTLQSRGCHVTLSLRPRWNSMWWQRALE